MYKIFLVVSPFEHRLRMKTMWLFLNPVFCTRSTCNTSAGYFPSTWATLPGLNTSPPLTPAPLALARVTSTFYLSCFARCGFFSIGQQEGGFVVFFNIKEIMMFLSFQLSHGFASLLKKIQNPVLTQDAL